MSERPQTVVNVNLGGHPGDGRSPRPPAGTPRSLDVAFFCWLLLGGLGAHRFYLRRPHALTILILSAIGAGSALAGVGFLLLLAVGLWLLVDLFLLDRWVAEYNAHRLLPGGAPPSRGASKRLRGNTPDLRILLLREADRRNGRLTVTQGVMATGRDFEDVRACLQTMVLDGHADADNDPGTGAVFYVFPELT